MWCDWKDPVELSEFTINEIFDGPGNTFYDGNNCYNFRKKFENCLVVKYNIDPDGKNNNTVGYAAIK